MTTIPEILDCGHPVSEHSPITTGWGTTPDGRRHCYACCAEADCAQLLADGKGTLYLTDKGVTNWTGHLVFRVGSRKKGRHNVAGTRTDVRFVGPDGKTWHGVQYGDFTQICHVRRLKGA